MQLDSYCFKIRMNDIFEELKWKDPTELIDSSSALFVHKIVTTEQPTSLSLEIRRPRTRNSGNITTVIRPKTSRLTRTGLYTGVINYNRIPHELKSLNTVQIRKKLKTRRLNDKPP